MEPHEIEHWLKALNRLMTHGVAGAGVEYVGDGVAYVGAGVDVG